MSTFTTHLGDGTTKLFAVSFPYLDRAHVRVLLNGVLQLEPGDYEWQHATQIRLRAAPAQDALVQFHRATEPSNALVTYQNGAVLSAADLNTATLQNFYRSQEIQDQVNGYLEASIIRFASEGTPGSLTPEQLIESVAQEVLASELTQDLQERINDIDANAESILEQAQRLTTIQDVVDALTGGGEGIVTLITNETNARIAGDTAIVSDLELIGARSGDNLAWVLDTGTVRVSPTESLATRLASLSASDSTNTAAIATEQAARIAADTAIASNVTAVTASAVTNAAAIITEATARSSADTAEATARLALASVVGTNTAAINTEASTRASADTSLASSITTLTSTSNGHTSSIQTLQTVVTGAGGLTAQFMVKTDVNGRVAGFGLYSDGATSEFTVLANKFSIVDPGSPTDTPTVPFAVVDGVVYMQDVVIGSAVIEDAAIGTIKLANGAATEVFTDSDVAVTITATVFDNPLTTINEITFTPSATADVFVSAVAAISYLTTAGFTGALFSYGIQKNADSILLSDFSLPFSSAELISLPVCVTRRFSVTGGVPVTFKFVGGKLNSGQTVQAINAEMRAELIKR